MLWYLWIGARHRPPRIFQFLRWEMARSTAARMLEHRGQDSQDRRQDPAPSPPAGRLPTPVPDPDRPSMEGPSTTGTDREAGPSQARRRRLAAAQAGHLPRRRPPLRDRLHRSVRQRPGRTRRPNDPPTAEYLWQLAHRNRRRRLPHRQVLPVHRPKTRPQPARRPPQPVRGPHLDPRPTPPDLNSHGAPVKVTPPAGAGSGRGGVSRR